MADFANWLYPPGQTWPPGQATGASDWDPEAWLPQQPESGDWQPSFGFASAPSKPRPAPEAPLSGVLPQQPPQQRFVPGTRKRKLCIHHEAGNCRYGADCNFAHGVEDLEPDCQEAVTKKPQTERMDFSGLEAGRLTKSLTVPQDQVDALMTAPTRELLLEVAGAYDIEFQPARRVVEVTGTAVQLEKAEKALQRMVAHCNWGASDSKIRAILRPRLDYKYVLASATLAHVGEQQAQPKMSSLVPPIKTVEEEDDAPPAFVATVSLDPLGLVECKSDEKAQVFTIAFSKSHGHAGIKFAYVDDLLVVEDVGADHIAQWPMLVFVSMLTLQVLIVRILLHIGWQKDEMVRVQPMDRIVAINEKRGTAEELLDLFRVPAIMRVAAGTQQGHHTAVIVIIVAQEEGDVELTLEHPRHFSIELHRGKTKAGRKIGLEVSAHDGPLGIVILKVLEDGLIPSYNSTAEKGMDIKAYSSIYAINGKAWPSLTLLRMLEKLEVFK
ncbi:unnamed protein product, partial [Symbiodinium microadriaticum]